MLKTKSKIIQIRLEEEISTNFKVSYNFKKNKNIFGLLDPAAPKLFFVKLIYLAGFNLPS